MIADICGMFRSPASMASGRKLTAQQALAKILEDDDSDTSDLSLDEYGPDNDSEPDDAFETIGTDDTTVDATDGTEDHLDTTVSSADEPTNKPTTGVTRGRGRGRRGSAQRGRGQGVSATDRGAAQTVNVTSNTDVKLQFIAKSGMKWDTVSPVIPNRRRLQQNIVREHAGPTGKAKEAKSIEEIFSLFVTNDMVDMIVKYTNQEGQRLTATWNENHPDQQKAFLDTNNIEIKAVIGLMLLRGVYHSHHERLSDMWSEATGRPVFRATMSRERFKLILRMMRFDDRSTRDQRRQHDKFAPIRVMFDIFNGKCREMFTLSENVTIDETLRRFRGRCAFKVYMPNKPGKYGILFCVLTDSNARYVSRMIPYTGKATDGADTSNSSADIVKALSEHIRGSGRNITMDRYYTSVELATELYKNHNLTVLGTINSNRRHVPDELKCDRGRLAFSTLFAWNDSVMIASYVPKPRKVVLMLSTEHDQPDISQRSDRKPVVILDYNATKGGVDTVDQMIDIYQTKVASRRWPMTVFYTMIDISALNSLVIWIYKNPTWNASKPDQRRRLFLSELGMTLIKPQLENRATQLNGLTRSITCALGQILGRNVHLTSQAPVAAEGAERKRCHVCVSNSTGRGFKRTKYNNANKSASVCSICGKTTCGKHSRVEKNFICHVCDM
jgi:hypothetical protein